MSTLLDEGVVDESSESVRTTFVATMFLFGFNTGNFGPKSLLLPPIGVLALEFLVTLRIKGPFKS